MEKSDFFYKRKPAFISFLIVYVCCFGISLLLKENSPAISRVISRWVMKSDIPYLHQIQNLPYGTILSFPFLIYGIRMLLWNVMTSYEITSSQIRLLAGSLSRKERIFLISSFNEVTFKQTLIEAPFRVGSLVLKKGDAELTVKGIHDIGFVVESIRGKVNTLYR